MSKAVRYFSRSGNTKTIAEAIADGAGVSAVSITDKQRRCLRLAGDKVNVIEGKNTGC